MLIVVAAMIATPLSYAGQTPEDKGLALIRQADDRYSGYGDSFASLRMVLRNRQGQVSERRLRIRALEVRDDGTKSLCIFDSPADVKGTVLLTHTHKDQPDDQWLYLPALKKTRRIVSSEKGKSFMSSEFSNADMSSPAPSDFKSRHLDKSGQNGQWIIESIPADDKKADEYGYSRKISYIRISDHQVTKMEFYNFDNVLYKIIEIKNIQNLSGGKFLIQDMVSENLITKRKSEIHFSEIKEGSKIDDSLFSLQNLER